MNKLIINKNYFKMRFLILLGIILLIYRSSFSKSFDEVGVKFGMSISNNNFKYKSIGIDRDFNNYYGFDFDVFFKGIDFDIIDFIGQISFSQKGCSETFVSTFVDSSSPQGYREGDPITFKNRIDYISASILCRLKYRFKKINPYIFFGPRIDFPINTDAKSTKSVYDNINKNIGLSFGIGSMFYIFNSNRLIVEFQYNYDMNAIYKSSFLEVTKNSCEIKCGIVL